MLGLCLDWIFHKNIDSIFFLIVAAGLTSSSVFSHINVLLYVKYAENTHESECHGQTLVPLLWNDVEHFTGIRIPRPHCYGFQLMLSYMLKNSVSSWIFAVYRITLRCLLDITYNYVDILRNKSLQIFREPLSTDCCESASQQKHTEYMDPYQWILAVSAPLPLALYLPIWNESLHSISRQPPRCERRTDSVALMSSLGFLSKVQAPSRNSEMQEQPQPSYEFWQMSIKLLGRWNEGVARRTRSPWTSAGSLHQLRSVMGESETQSHQRERSGTGYLLVPQDLEPAIQIRPNRDENARAQLSWTGCVTILCQSIEPWRSALESDEFPSIDILK
ncbi:hypothetical protein RF11_07383 [Thelohanellus kitauei]|uniref:Uncharacterized protein n=1 Tax=Thelohanellus kitauei TaxID=669202 RepID=A0A0C2N0T6_THEKT|nr:hypothetical protein RF11_07383 [Thelohanellus kitauei]